MRSAHGLTGVALACLALWVGCREPGLRNGRGALEVTPQDVDFGAVALGQEREVELLLTNRSRTPYSVYELKTGNDAVAVDFEPLRLQAGEKAQVKVRFRPTAAGDHRGQLSIATDEHRDPYGVNFTGRGVKAVAELDTAQLDFGRVPLETSKTLSLTVRNPSEVATRVRFTLDGEAAHYASAETGAELPLQPGESRQIAFEFRPTFLGPLPARAQFVVCEGCAPFVVSLMGEGFVDKLEVLPPRIEFGRVSLGSSVIRQVIINNLGTETIPFRGARIVDATEGVYAVSGAQDDLAGGGQKILTVTFTPKTPGVVSGSPKLQLELPAPNVPSGVVNLPIFGEGGLFCVAVLPTALDFGTVPEGHTAQRRVDLFNRCAYDVTLSDAHLTSDGNGAFSLEQPAPATVLPAGKITSVRVRFTPRASAPAFEGALALRIQERAASTTEHVSLRGATHAFPPCTWELLPPALDFGAVAVGSEVTLGVALKNAGNDECFVGGMQLVPGADAQFAAEPLDSSLLKPGETVVLRVRFRPASVGAFAAQAEGWVNHPTNNHPIAPITGRGVQGCFALEPAGVDYGPSQLFCGARTQEIVGVNRCTAPVTVTGVTLDAPASTEFSLAQPRPSPVVLAPGQRLPFAISYAPTNEGIDTAALRVTVDGTMYAAGLQGLGQSQGGRTDRFVQDAQTRVDVLFVIDNSGSMTEEQQTLGVNFNAFLSAAQAHQVDYHIGVTTTGIEPALYGWSICPGGVSGGEAGRLFPVIGGGPRIITPSTPNAAAVFAQNVNVGWCHANEQGLEGAYLALSNPLASSADDLRTLAPADGNAGFLRDEAKLAIVFVTDEEDFSLRELSFYERFFRSVKHDDPTQLSISAIAGPLDLATCPTASSSGTRYIALANATGGAVENICASDWSRGLANISRTTFGPRRAFPLSSAPMDSSQLTVFVNGAPASGWTYDAQRNLIIFDEHHAPTPQSVVEISYPPGC